MTYQIRHKLTSARRLLAFIAALCLLIFTVATAAILYANRAKLEVGTIMTIFTAIMLVVQGVYKDYQNKDRDHKDEK